MLLGRLHKRTRPGRVFNEMVAIITRMPWLNERINIIRFRRELEDMANGSTFRVLSADVAPVHGLNPNRSFVTTNSARRRIARFTMRCAPHWAAGRNR